MKLKLLLGLLFVVWRSTAAEEYTNHWRATEDVANVEFCSHDGYRTAGNCVCDVDYSGNFCLNRKCRNFGYNGQNFPNGGKIDRCICPPGFLGRNCEPVLCVPGKDQVYSSFKNEKKVSLLVSYNTEIVETWKTGDIGRLICNKTDYWRSFNYNYDDGNYDVGFAENQTTCMRNLETYLTADPCVLDDGITPGPCQPLNIDNLNTLVQNSPPNSIVFVVTNMNLTSLPDSTAESIIATSIARRIQINVLVYNNTNLLATDPSLVYLSNIASATFGTFILPSIKPVNEHYDIVNTLFNNWDQGYQVSAVFTSEVKNLPVDNTLDLYIAVQHDYGAQPTINVDPAPMVVSKTDFWNLYKLPAGSFGLFLSVTGQTANTNVLMYSSGGLQAYSAFTSATGYNNNVADTAYSVSASGASYSLVVRLEADNFALNSVSGLKNLGTPSTVELGENFYSRPICQFNYMFDATCTSVGASIITLVTTEDQNKRRSVSFPVYCASVDYANSIYGNLESETVEITMPQFSQSFSKDITCAGEIEHEVYGGRSFVIIAENSKDTTDATKSSADNVFRNKNSVIYQLSDFLSNDKNRYGDFVAALNYGDKPTITERSADYGIFLTKLMNSTNNNNSPPLITTPVTVRNLLVNTIDISNLYSDILFVVNYNVSISDDDVAAIQTALEVKRSKLFILFVQTYMNYTNDIYYQLNRLAVGSGGVTIRLNNYDDLHTFFVQYFPLLVANDIVAKAYSENQKAGIALNNVYLQKEDYYLLVTNEDLAGDGIVSASVSVDNANVTNQQTIGELQLFSITPNVAGVYNIPIRFSTDGLAQFSNAVLYATTKAADFISLSFVDKDGKNRNDVVYNEGVFTPVIYSSQPFVGLSSNISITYSDKANPAKAVYSGSITNLTGCSFKNYNWTTDFNWKCSVSGGLYHVKIDRVADNGIISRTFPITCLGALSGDCLNGGTLVGNACVCPMQYTGAKCEAPRCLNGGTLTPADTCLCNPAFPGTFCESSVANCSSPVKTPDYRSDLASLVIVADVNALALGGMTADFGVTGVPITVILYGDGNEPRIVQSTTNSQHLQDVLGPVTMTTPSTTSSPAPANSDMYNALKIALANQLTNRAFIVVYTSNADVPVDGDFLIRLAARRAEIRVLSIIGTESDNAKTLALVGNSIPFAIEKPIDFQRYLTEYIEPLFQSLQYQAIVPQRVFNVFATDQLTKEITVNIPKETTFDNAKAIVYVHVYNGYVGDTPTPIGKTRIYSFTYNPQDGKTLVVTPASNGISYYAVEIVGYLKTSYLFNVDNANGANEVVTAGVLYNKANTLHVYTAPYFEVAASNPANFPYLSIKEILSNGTVSDPTTVLFSNKLDPSCFFKYFTQLDVCSQSSTIGYQVQLTTRASETETRQQQFTLTCFKTTLQSGTSACYGHGSPEPLSCKCDLNYGGIDCSEPICVHGGVRDMSVCRCPIGAYGLLCNQTFFDLPTTVSPPTTLPVTSTPSPSSTSVASTVVSTITTPIPSTTTSAPEVRAVAFIIDILGSDDYAYNQTIQSITTYFKAFGYSHWVMLVGNLNENYNLTFDFQQYTDEQSLFNRTYGYWAIRSLPGTKTSNVTAALTKIRDAYNSKGTEFRNAVSMNIFYLTQIELKVADVTSSVGGLEEFTKSAVVYSPFAKAADQAIVDSLKPFSNDVTAVRDYYNGLKAMVASTAANSSAVIPPKPATQSCVYGLQSNIRVAIDRSNITDPSIETALMSFLNKFRGSFNYIENDDNRCSDPSLPPFYKERTALTAFPYYDGVAKTARFCPSQYTSMLSFQVTGKNKAPTFSSNYVKVIGKNINSADCICNRFFDDKTTKFVLWLPRAPGPVTDEYLGYWKLNTTNAYHFVVPFYDITAESKATDLYYQILAAQDQVKGGDYYLLPNAATVGDVQTDVVDPLYQKLCETAGVDPTAVPPSLFDSIFENRHYDYYD